MTDFKAVIRKALKVHMAEADMTAAQLADTSEVSVDAIRQYLRGETVPLMETTCKLAEALNCTPNDLCGFDSSKD